MYCKTCKQEVENTLELYNGTFACARCRTKFNIEALQITPTNDELFTLSEILFHTALQQRGNRAKYGRDIAKAVAMCKQAAFQGHPKAVIRLAYFYEMGYGGVNAVSAFKMACQYYETVWSNDFTESTIAGYAQLRQIAAKRHLTLLENVPSSLRTQERYGYKKVAKDMKDKGVIEGNYHAHARSMANDADDGARISNILDGCMDKVRAPLFGLIAVQGNTLVEWAHTTVKTGKKTEKMLEYYLGKRNITLYLAGGKIEPYRIVSTRDIPDNAESPSSQIKADATYYLCFFNSGVARFGHAIKFLEPKDSDHYLLLDFIDKASIAGYEDYIFYSDDVLMYRETKLESLQHATKDLVEAVMKTIE